MVECVSCRTQWGDGQDYCGRCGSPTRHIAQHKSNAAAIVVFVVLGAGLALVLGGALSSVSFKREIPTNVPKNYYTEITATDLAAEFEANEVRAESKYKGEKYRVSGKITGIGKEILGKPYLIIDNKVQAVFEKGAEAAIARYDKGMQVTGNCEVGGKLVYVHLRDCSL